jgi:hypothetical protein
MTARDLCSVLVRLLGLSMTAGRGQHLDVADGQWVHSALALCYGWLAIASLAQIGRADNRVRQAGLLQW